MRGPLHVGQGRLVGVFELVGLVRVVVLATIGDYECVSTPIPGGRALLVVKDFLKDSVALGIAAGGDAPRGHGGAARW